MEKNIKIGLLGFITYILLAGFFVYVALDPFQDNFVRLVMLVLAGCEILSIFETIKDYWFYRKEKKELLLLEGTDFEKWGMLVDELVDSQNDILDSYNGKLYDKTLANEIFYFKDEYINFLVSMFEFYAAKLKEIEKETELEENLLETEF